MKEILNDLENKYIDNISRRLCLDSSREKFARQACRTLFYISQNLFKGRVGYQRLLLGRKGVGKTTFLKVMQEEAKCILGDNLITVYADYSGINEFELPSSLICNELNSKNIPNTNRIRFIDNLLEEKGKFVFLVLDEIQNLYLSNENGARIIGEISKIGCSSAGRIFCTITGSSNDLRQLCFAKLPQENRVHYPNYCSLDLNSTKYAPKWIYPFLEVTDFRNIVKNLYQRYHSDFVKEIQSQKIAETRMYLMTGGNARLIEDYILNGECDSYSVSLRQEEKNPNDIRYKILKAVHECTDAFVDLGLISTAEELPNDISAFEAWTKLINYQIIFDKIDDNLNDILPIIYNLADSGHIRYFDNQQTKHISLGSPLIYLQLAIKEANTITLNEAFALKFPYDPNQSIAETVTLRILAKNANKFLKTKNSSFEIKNTTIENIVLKYEYQNIYSHEIHATCDQNKIVNRLFKECFESNKDVFGIDGLLLEKDQSNENELIAHRIQIKLGNSNIKADEANKIINHVNSQKENFLKCFTAANKVISMCINYLVTTRGIEKTIREMFIKNEWQIVGKAELEKIWPDDIKALGKPYK